MKLDQDQIGLIVSEVMNQQYGADLDSQRGCWPYTHDDQGRRTEYCMEAAGVQTVETPSGPVLYLRTWNQMDPDDGYEAVTPGLMGAFQIAVAGDGSWRYLAKSEALVFGTMGHCGCDEAKFVQLGRDYYGWMFTSGGTWQGITVSNHEIVAPHNGKFKNISELPEIVEEDQDAVYSLSISADAAFSGEVFPLKAVKTVSGKKEGEVVVQFDSARWVYPRPGNF